jgi:excisionase family DNA binding protein
MVAEGTTAKERRPSSRALLTAEEVAEYFGVTMTTVYRWCREGRIPCLKIGKHWRVRREELMALLKESEGAERSR